MGIYIGRTERILFDFKIDCSCSRLESRVSHIQKITIYGMNINFTAGPARMKEESGAHSTTITTVCTGTTTLPYIRVVSGISLASLLYDHFRLQCKKL